MVAQQQRLTSRSFQRGLFLRYVSIMKFNIGSLTSGQTAVDIERNEYIHFDGYTLRFNGDSPDQQAWVDYHNVAARTISLSAEIWPIFCGPGSPARHPVSPCSFVWTKRPG